MGVDLARGPLEKLFRDLVGCKHRYGGNDIDNGHCGTRIFFLSTNIFLGPEEADSGQ